MTIHGMLKKARKRHGHSLEGAARLLTVSARTVWRWEHERRIPSGLYYDAVRGYILKVMPERAGDLPQRPHVAAQEAIPEG